MARPTKPKYSEVRAPSQINDWIVRLIDKGEVSEELFDLVCKLAIGSIRRKPKRTSPSGTTSKTPHKDFKDVLQDVMDEARDLAGDFLLFHLKSNNLRLLFTMTELQIEFSRYLTRRNNPEGHELWEVLSEAVHELAKAGKAQRLDAPHTAINTNTALWAAKGVQPDTSLDVNGFYTRAKQIGCYYPQREEGRIIPPSKALELAEKLLILAKAPIPFQELVNEARNHVVLSMQFTSHVAEDGHASDEQRQEQHILTAEQDHEIMLWITEESPSRASAIWEEIMLQNNGVILCLYILPKHFLGQKTTLSQFGTPQRVGEQSMSVMQVLAKHLKLDRLPSDGRLKDNDTFAKALLYLASRTSELLSRKCSENGWHIDLSKTKATRGGKKEPRT